MWLLIIAAALAVWAVLIHNELVQLRVMAEGAWADLQAQLNRRQEGAANADQAVQDAARYYNTLVRDYNTKFVLLPDRLVARAGKFQPKALFEPDAPT